MSATPFPAGYAIPAALVVATLIIVIAIPVARGQHDETGLLVSWLTTPIAAFLFAKTRARSVVLSAAVTATIIALVVAGVSYAMWRAFAEPWMFDYLYATVAILAVSVVFEIFGAAMIALVASALRNRTGEHLQ